MQKHITIYETLKRIGDAEQRKLDTWSISFTSGGGLLVQPNPIALQAKLILSALRTEPVHQSYFKLAVSVHFRRPREYTMTVHTQCMLWYAGVMMHSMHAGHGNIFKELPHSLEVVSFNKGERRPPQTPGKSQRCSIALLDESSPQARPFATVSPVLLSPCLQGCSCSIPSKCRAAPSQWSCYAKKHCHC